MTTNPPPYAPGETKPLYPPVQGDPQQQYVQQPGGYYPPQGQPMVATAPGTAAVTYYPSGPPQQQQPQQFVVAQQPPVVVQTQQPPAPSFVCHILFSCCVTWCCCCPCGFLAFILAMIGYHQANSSPASARQLGTASIVFSVLGIIIAVVVAILVLFTGYGAAAFPDMVSAIKGCHEKGGHCYRSKTFVLSESDCKNLYSNSYYSSNYCYHD